MWLALKFVGYVGRCRGESALCGVLTERAAMYPGRTLGGCGCMCRHACNVRMCVCVIGCVWMCVSCKGVKGRFYVFVLKPIIISWTKNTGLRLWSLTPMFWELLRGLASLGFSDILVVGVKKQIWYSFRCASPAHPCHPLVILHWALQEILLSMSQLALILVSVCFQEEDLNCVRERWSEALIKRREYLDEQIKKIINKRGES